MTYKSIENIYRSVSERIERVSRDLSDYSEMSEGADRKKRRSAGYR